MKRSDVQAEFDKLNEEFKSSTEGAFFLEDKMFLLTDESLTIQLNAYDEGLIILWYDTISEVKVREKDNFYLDEYTEQYRGTTVTITIKTAVGNTMVFNTKYLNEDRF